MSKTEEFDYPEVFDSRDVIERIEYLEADENELDEDEREELTVLRALAEEGPQYSEDWQYGSTFIRDDYFKQYAIEFASEISSDIDPQVADSWPFCHIDWDAAADSLKQDYSSLTVGDIEYWTR